ncbi:MAG: hypothetical protein GWM92_12940 [Gemmatimonadetes bacterium]|nr:gluconate 2-dehydrogenase subunit 3 family protein [Gemmatimonadota bacterium]NIR79611.1 gluconate 2-dehydrogenase subunit 3 family protein [Gemmatimonadota bacterium]NIT88292.1 gluconate 2-dehydrogenase subunit 3 family protein [Gemmatimonadota bacterium]NIU32106.1 gluconate 2-dehydrogenase subunit 3 family protein [Gemmatimonadota bacterium]NIU36701.1 hypothetical protein [Gemmatimonadota bacterium]
MTHDRRAFLRSSAAALSAAALGGCVPDAPARAGDQERLGLDPVLLRAAGEVVLPGELGAGGREEAVRGFEAWIDAFEPVAELNHGYGTSEIRYGPPDPAPRWAAQLRALETEARRRHDAGFAQLAALERRALLERQIEDEGPGLPPPARARHVAVGLLAWWLETPEATDRCYGVEIGKETCRGIGSAPERPTPLEGPTGGVQGGRASSAPRTDAPARPGD